MSAILVNFFVFDLWKTENIAPTPSSFILFVYLFVSGMMLTVWS